ncbi:unnamed protein product [Amoebophrya sp. A120]|nr:unnamed protein product [Amoebophrya sp. A120]|eukprot:GSA120T00019749001.1
MLTHHLLWMQFLARRACTRKGRAALPRGGQEDMGRALAAEGQTE